MDITRKEFIRKLFHAGGACLFCLLGSSWLLKACAPPGEVGEDAPEEVKDVDPAVWLPAYLQMEEALFAARVDKAYGILENCELCPRRCRVNRLAGETGFCRAPGRAVVYTHQLHFGEELPLVGRGGSGTIFFSSCNLRCVFCQNWPIAHEGRGREVSDEELAEMMLDLQRNGSHNINLVTPTHFLPNILNAARIAGQKGLTLPLCYNTSGYELTEMIDLLDGIVDIYLPDLKFMDGDEAERYNLAAAYDYPQLACEAIIAMHRQVGRLATDQSGIALRGLMIRHLVMPNRVAGTESFVRWVAENLPKDTYVNIMSQYRVEYKAFDYEPIARAITSEEYIEAMEWAFDAGLTNLDERSLANLDLHRRLVE